MTIPRWKGSVRGEIFLQLEDLQLVGMIQLEARWWIFAAIWADVQDDLVKRAWQMIQHQDALSINPGAQIHDWQNPCPYKVTKLNDQCLGTFGHQISDHLKQCTTIEQKAQNDENGGWISVDISISCPMPMPKAKIFVKICSTSFYFWHTFTKQSSNQLGTLSITI